jgi:hypothetical protein
MNLGKYQWVHVLIYKGAYKVISNQRDFSSLKHSPLQHYLGQKGWSKVL